MKKVLALIILIIIAASSYYLILEKKKNAEPAVQETASVPELTEAEASVPLTEQYSHPVYPFSFKYPEGFTVNTTQGVDGEMLVVQNAKGQGFQMRMQLIDEDIKDITVEMIQQDLPDILIKDPQDLLIGQSGKGVAFVSNDPFFGGSSREIWFVYKKVFYQITTYLTYDPILKRIFETWEFR